MSKFKEFWKGMNINKASDREIWDWLHTQIPVPSKNKPVDTQQYINAVANKYKISRTEAIDIVWDFIEAAFGREYEGMFKAQINKDNSAFKVGDRVQVDSDVQPDGGKKGKVNRLVGTGGVKVDLDDGQSETFSPDEIKKI